MKRIALLAIPASLFVAPAASAFPHVTVPFVVAPRPLTPLGPEGSEYPWWGNDIPYGAPESVGIADCGFAAAADWEILTLHRVPIESQIIKEFYAAGGSASNGLDETIWMRWWAQHGISGVRVSLMRRPNSWLDGLVQAHRAVIAVSGGHALVVAGFGPGGPEVITYGETRQESWAQWDERPEEIFVPVVYSAGRSTLPPR